MGWAIRRGNGEDVPYLLTYGKRGKLEGDAEGGVLCGDEEGDCMSALALEVYLAHALSIEV